MYMSHPTKGKRISPSLVNREPLPNAIFGTVDERNRYVVQMREVGHTLQAIGDSLSLTREMIRLIVKANAGPSARTVRVNREAKKQIQAHRNNRWKLGRQLRAEKFKIVHNSYIIPLLLPINVEV